MTDDERDTLEPQGGQGRRRVVRLVLLVVILVGIVVVARLTGLTEHLTTERLRALMQGAGLLGVLLFLGAFSLGELCHVPAWVFVSAAVIAYGQLPGAAVAFVGAMLSVTVSFFVVRGVGGRPLGAIRWRWVRRILSHLDTRPLRTILILRLVFWAAPQLNYALALSNVRFRHYFLGSALGLAPPVAGLALLIDYVVR